MKPDPSLNVDLNGATIQSQRVADRLRVPIGEKVAWARIFVRPPGWMRRP